jgi:hypothetical protein
MQLLKVTYVVKVPDDIVSGAAEEVKAGLRDVLDKNEDNLRYFLRQLPDEYGEGLRGATLEVSIQED